MTQVCYGVPIGRSSRFVVSRPGGRRRALGFHNRSRRLRSVADRVIPDESAALALRTRRTQEVLEKTMNVAAKVGKCPVAHGATNMSMRQNRDWWPNQLNVSMLHQNSPAASPMDKDFNYIEEFKKARSGSGQAGSPRSNDRFQGMVAGRFRALRSLLHFAWPGTAPGLTAPLTGVADRPRARSVSRRSTAGPTTSTLTRPAG